MNMFKTCQGKQIELTEYIKNYITTHPGIEIIIGSDSQNYSKETVYVTAVILYTPGRGGHVVYERERQPREQTRSVRLMNEVWRSVETANKICDAGLPKPTFIDIDVNPDRKCKSNEVFDSAKGLVEGMGYKCRCKHLNVMATCTADHLVRGKK